MKLKKWFWGLFFLMAGAAVIINQLGYFGDINVFTLVFTILLIPIIIKSISRLNFSGILFPLAFIGILYAEQLGITDMTPWPILLTALFASIGLSIIFHSSKRHYFSSWVHNEEDFSTVINEKDDNKVDVKTSFGSSIKYVNSNDFQKGVFMCSFGALKVYFDNAKVSDEGAEIILDVSFGGVELYIPKEWNIVNKVNTTLGGLDEKNRNNSTGGPEVVIRGNISLAGVEIIYI